MQFRTAPHDQRRFDDVGGVNRAYLTTREAAAYCGFRTTGGIRKALKEGMQHHYSTVRGHEQHEGLSKVVDLMTARAERASSKAETESGGASGGASMP